MTKKDRKELSKTNKKVVLAKKNYQEMIKRIQPFLPKKRQEPVSRPCVWTSGDTCASGCCLP